MFTILAILLACEKPQPLPPRRNEMEIANTRMVQMTDFRGYYIDQPRPNIAKRS